MTWAGSRGRRTLGVGTGSRKSTNGENRTLVRGGKDMVHGRGGGNPALGWNVKK